MSQGRAPWWRVAAKQWPLAVVLAGIVAGVAVVAAGHWLRGVLVIGAAVVLAALERLLLAERAGLLQLRSRWFDVALMAALGLAIIAVALWVPGFSGNPNR